MPGQRTSAATNTPRAGPQYEIRNGRRYVKCRKIENPHLCFDRAPVGMLTKAEARRQAAQRNNNHQPPRNQH